MSLRRGTSARALAGALSRTRWVAAAAFVACALAWLPDAQAAVTLLYFRGTAEGMAVRLEWETATEYESAGFFVRRGPQRSGAFDRVSGFLPSRGDGLTGARYDHLDGPLPSPGTYWYVLEAIDYQGASTEHGPVSVTVGGAMPPTAGPTTAPPRPTSAPGANDSTATSRSPSGLPTLTPGATERTHATSAPAESEDPTNASAATSRAAVPATSRPTTAASSGSSASGSFPSPAGGQASGNRASADSGSAGDAPGNWTPPASAPSAAWGGSQEPTTPHAGVPDSSDWSDSSGSSASGEPEALASGPAQSDDLGSSAVAALSGRVAEGAGGSDAVAPARVRQLAPGAGPRAPADGGPAVRAVLLVVAAAAGVVWVLGRRGSARL